MHEWNIVFQHAQTRGLLLNFVLAEREQPNIDWLGGSSATGGVAMSDERKLYLKNLVAMFAHNPGVKWNLCEENRDRVVVVRRSLADDKYLMLKLGESFPHRTAANFGFGADVLVYTR